MENTLAAKELLAAKAVILHEGKILILRESGKYFDGTNVGKYDFPGGRLQEGEDLHVALIREVHEECKLEVKIGSAIFTDEWNPVINQVPTKITGTFYQCIAENTNVVLSEDHDDYQWVNPGDAEKYALVPATRKVLEILSQK